MAKRRKRSSSPKGAHCKVVVVRGTRRKMCWGANGKLKSNKRA